MVQTVTWQSLFLANYQKVPKVDCKTFWSSRDVDETETKRKIRWKIVDTFVWLRESTQLNGQNK